MRRPLASAAAILHALVTALVLAWPTLADGPFPIPGYRNAVPGPALWGLTVAALALAFWVTVFWAQTQQRPWWFVACAMLCFLVAAMLVSVPIGVGFAVLSVLVRSK